MEKLNELNYQGSEWDGKTTPAGRTEDVSALPRTFRARSDLKGFKLASTKLKRENI